MSAGVWTVEQVSHRLPPEQGPPTPALMFRAVMVHVTALAKGCEVRAHVVGGVVIAVGGCQHDLRCADDAKILDGWKSLECSPLPITPGTDAGIPPASVAEVVDSLPMRPATALTSAAGSAEADRRRELRPVDGVEEAVLAPDRH